MKFWQQIKKTVNQANKVKNQIQRWKGFVEQVRPEADFDETTVSPAPDYQKIEAWLVHPLSLGKSTYLPKSHTIQSTLPIDVFYIHPTTFFDKKHWNAPLKEEKRWMVFLREMVVPSQVSLFNECERIYAPNYRQATFYAFLNVGKDVQKALELAYQDVAFAFDFYIKNENNGRPFILAGHSQGSLHGIRLLEEKIDNSDLWKQLVAAYLPGFRFPKDKFKNSLENIQPGLSPYENHCVVAWDTYLEGGTPGRRLDFRIHSYNNGTKWQRAGSKKPFGINPLTWTDERKTASANMHVGGVIPLFEKSQNTFAALWKDEPLHMNCVGLSEVYPHQIEARLGKDGFLFVSPPKNRLFRQYQLPLGNLHLYDVALFYMSIRHNVRQRANNFLKKPFVN